jgi:hypothetical protein
MMRNARIIISEWDESRIDDADRPDSDEMFHEINPINRDVKRIISRPNVVGHRNDYRLDIIAACN